MGKKAIKKQKYVGKYKMNHMGSSASMETEGVKRIFQISENDSEVENVYDGIHVEEKECVGHVQKQVGTTLRKLKKENKGYWWKGKANRCND